MNFKVRSPAIYLRSDFTPRFSLALTRKDVASRSNCARNEHADAPRRDLRARDGRRARPRMGGTRCLDLPDIVGRAPRHRRPPSRKGRSRGLTQRAHVHRGCGAIHPGSTRQAVNEGQRAVALRLIPPLATADYWIKSVAIPAPIQATFALAFLVRACRDLWSMVPFAGTSPGPFH
jgi:hypothetical protein